MSQILPSSRRLFRESAFVSTLGGMALLVEKEEDARERDLFERAHRALGKCNTLFLGVVFRVFTHLFSLSLC